MVSIMTLKGAYLSLGYADTYSQRFHIVNGMETQVGISIAKFLFTLVQTSSTPSRAHL